MPQQQQRRGVGPVKVVQDQDQRMLVGDRSQQRRDRFEQQELFALGGLAAGAGEPPGPGPPSSGISLASVGAVPPHLET